MALLDIKNPTLRRVAIVVVVVPYTVGAFVGCALIGAAAGVHVLIQSLPGAVARAWRGRA